MILPPLGRFDRRDEIEEADKWLGRFASGLESIYADWLPKQFVPLDILELTKIPYVSRFSFGEPLPVLTHSVTDPEMPGFYLENCAPLLESDFRDAARIIEPNARVPDNKLAEIRARIFEEPMDEKGFNCLLRVAETEMGEGAQLAALLNGAGTALVTLARFDNAEPFLRRALTMDKKVLGPDHRFVARDLNDLAQLLQDTNRLDEAEPEMRRALEILVSSQRKTGHAHPHMETVIGSYRSVLTDIGHDQNKVETLITRLIESVAHRIGS